MLLNSSWSHTCPAKNSAVMLSRSYFWIVLAFWVFQSESVMSSPGFAPFALTSLSDPSHRRSIHLITFCLWKIRPRKSTTRYRGSQMLCIIR
ncbi:uncharacterized protein BJ212DRAFT_1381240 [Suillus subaureus]|uniref:Uncharacterized protein n=1 Tax=Suillus subaureus TaxID=48587 RepID=A0A9P7E1D1_9AGAM|nr:uncharacterized protein BJ212DRAFT_1381240 [Suillus subaureus]KAG1808858.1 hypothetical protein BJ212DRAFT_1381240 [Suillus subaureus]